ncbi:hypothetical protein [Amycolatopsis sp. NPDC051071]
MPDQPHPQPTWQDGVTGHTGHPMIDRPARGPRGRARRTLGEGRSPDAA